MKRRLSPEIPVALTISERKRVKNVKLAMKPRTIPSGLCLFPLILPDKTIGRIGKIQGERIVTIPAKKANKISKIID